MKPLGKKILAFLINRANYIFILLFLLTLFNEFTIEPKTSLFLKEDTHLFLKNIFVRISKYIHYLTIAFGTITLWKNKDYLATISQKEKKEKKKHALGIIALTIFALGLISYKVGSFDFYNDEFQVVQTAYNYQQNNEFYKWDWLEDKSTKDLGCKPSDDDCHYTRAWPHTWLVAQSFEVFGLSEWSARLPSVIFGTLTVLTLYFFALFFTNSKQIAFLSSFVYSLLPIHLEFSRYTRMYIMMTFIFLVTTYLLYRGVTEKNNLKIKNKKIRSFIENNFNFNFSFLLPGLILMLLNAVIHRNSLIIVPIFFIFIVYKSLKAKEKKYSNSAKIGLLFLCLIALAYHLFDMFEPIFKYLTFFKEENIDYFRRIIRHPFGKNAGRIILAIALFSLPSFYLTRKKTKDKIIFLNLIVFFSLIFFVFVASRRHSMRYIFHIVPIAVIVESFILINIFRTFKSKVGIWALTIMVLLMTSWTFYSYTGKLFYGGKNEQPKLSKAFEFFKDNYDPQTDVLFASKLREFYLRDYPGEIKIIDINKKENYKVETFIADLKNREAGWIIWTHRKRKDIKDKVREHACANFNQIHGKCKNKNSLDDTNVEMLYFNKKTNNQLPSQINDQEKN